MFRHRERAFKQFKCPRPQCVKGGNMEKAGCTETFDGSLRDYTASHSRRQKSLEIFVIPYESHIETQNFLFRAYELLFK